MAESLAALPEGQRRAIELHHLQGLPLAEIADELGTTKSAVAGLLHRGLKALRATSAKPERGSLSYGPQLQLKHRIRSPVREPAAPEREQRLDEVIAAYLEALEAGNPVDRPP